MRQHNPVLVSRAISSALYEGSGRNKAFCIEGQLRLGLPVLS